MSEQQQPVTCLPPPPLPPKTKLNKRRTLEEKDNQDGIIISASYAAASSPSSYSARSSAITTVNLNTVDLNIPDGFQELTYSCKNSGKSHVVKILINPEESRSDDDQRCNISDKDNNSVVTSDVVPSGETCIRISVNNNNFQNHSNMVDAVGSPSHYYFNQFNNLMSSGQMSPSDTLDSGTCSDLDNTPSPFIKKKNSNGVSVTLIGSHKKTASLSSGAEIEDSDDNESHSSASSISCDSLNCGKVSPIAGKPTIIGARSKSLILPQNLLKDIRQRKDIDAYSLVVDEKSYEDRQQDEKQSLKLQEPDTFFDFHLNENDIKDEDSVPMKTVIEDETFAGYKDFSVAEKPATIKSAKGTVRGVRNRVRAGIATFLQINSAEKSYKEKDAGKVVVYTTTMGIIRDTYQACTKVKQILRTLLVKFEERDVFMSVDYQNEIRERMKCDQILVPQVFVDGQHCGDAETLERLNESGELRKILKAYKNPDVCSTCQMCGGYRLLPCTVCNGSKKSVHRNHFTAEFVALKCMNCDENGLVRCTVCS